VARQAAVAKMMRMMAVPPTREETDRDLLARYVAGEEAAFAVLVDRHGGLVLGVCKRVLPTVQDAEDACQAVFLILAKKAKANRWQPSIANWLYTTAWQVASKAKRSAYRRSQKEAQARASVPSTPLDQLSWREGLGILDEELSRLPSRYREPLILCYLEGLTRDEAATQLAIPSATLKSQLDRARKRLNTMLARRGLVPGLGLLAIETISPVNASPWLFDSLSTALKTTPSPAVAEMMKGIVVNTWIKKVALSLATVMGLAAVGVTAFTLRAQPEPSPKVAEQSAPKTAIVAEEKPTQVSGQVVDPDGKPVAGVKLYTFGYKNKTLKWDDDVFPHLLGETTADGKFLVSISNNFTRRFADNTLIAYHEKWGLAWQNFYNSDSQSLTIHLAKDLPIKGCILDTQGKPVVNATVHLQCVSDSSKTSLSDYLKNLKDTSLIKAEPEMGFRPGKIIKPVQTDSEGQFSIAGAGAERIALLHIKKQGMAPMIFWVVTRQNFDATPYNEILELPSNNLIKEAGFNGLFSPHFTFRAEKGGIVEGVVSDADSGKPIDGCQVSISVPYCEPLQAQTGSDGRYRLTGIPSYIKDLNISVNPPAKSAYLLQNMTFSDKRGSTPVRQDISLAMGVLAKGRVIDKQTGKGVQASIRLYPLPDNSSFDPESGYRGSYFSRTDDQGHFSMATIPGKSFVCVMAENNENYQDRIVNAYLRATPDPQYSSLFRPKGDSWTARAVNFDIYLAPFMLARSST
jgi:RNA polymerase sigma factor (sigma-70 family)